MARHEKETATGRKVLYKVFLGNGFTGEFSNVKAATAFLVHASGQLTSELHRINNEYSQLHNLYRQSFFYFQDARAKTDFRILEFQIRRGLEIADEKMNLAIDRAGLTNGNHFVVLHLLSACRELVQSASLLGSFLEQRTLRGHAQIAACARRNLEEISKSILQVGKENPQESEVSQPLSLIKFR